MPLGQPTLSQKFNEIKLAKLTKKAPTRIPPGGMGNGLERAYSKDDFIIEITISKH